MFLVIKDDGVRYATCFGWRPALVTFLVLAASGLSWPAWAEEGRCAVDVRVYDPRGNRLQFRVTRVSVQESPEQNLLASKPGVVETSGDRLLFLNRLLRRVFVATIEDTAGRRMKKQFILMQCPQRVSARFGVLETYGDVSFQMLQGRFSGCQFTGDWWVRAMPMFGDFSTLGAVEGQVGRDGSFALSGQISGERHVIVVGKDAKPIWVFAADVTLGRSNDVGLIDLAGRCPADSSVPTRVP